LNNSYDLSNDSPLKANGRFSRFSYIAWNCLMSIVVVAIVAILTIISPALLQFPTQSLPLPSLVVFGLIYIALFYFTIIFTIRRLHDRNHSGWFVLLLLVPLLNVVLAVYLLFAPGTPAANNFGSQRPTAGWETALAWLYIIVIIIALISLAFTGFAVQ
jgi:uncharacterized membrane protein YhaH (DUF805 family)